MAVKIGAIINETRRKSGLSQKELADIAGVGKTTVFDIEKGKQTVRFSSLQKVCKVLNLGLWVKDPFGNDSEVDNVG